MESLFAQSDAAAHVMKRRFTRIDSQQKADFVSGNSHYSAIFISETRGESRVRLANQMNTKRQQQDGDRECTEERKDALVIASQPFVSHKGLQTPAAYE